MSLGNGFDGFDEFDGETRQREEQVVVILSEARDRFLPRLLNCIELP
jgi:hypothetical protein